MHRLSSNARALGIPSSQHRSIASVLRSLAAAARRLRAGLVAARRRRQAIAELRRLDDRLLADLGVERDAIPALVDRLMESPPKARAPSAPAESTLAGPGVVSLAPRRPRARPRTAGTPAAGRCCAGGDAA